jgi:YegS/Rv2252/BmrU family lipid kinase
VTTLVLVNSSKKAVARPWLDLLEGEFSDCDLHFPESPEELKQLIAHHADSVERIVIGGGDGTMRRAAGALMTVGRPVGILPLGTANDLARSLAIPVTPVGAVQVMARNHTRRIDVGVVNGHHFFNAAQIGLGATVRKALSPKLKKALGPLSYAVGAWDAMRRMRPFTVEVEVGGECREFRSIHVTVGNGIQFGGGTPVAPGASLEDGQLDLLTVDPMPRWQLALLAAAVRAGRHHRVEHLHLLKGDKMRISTDRSMRITADGDPISRTPADFSVLPKAVTVYTGGRG